MLTTSRTTNFTTGETVLRGFEENDFIAALKTKDGSHYRLGVGADSGLAAGDQLVATWRARGDRVENQF